MLKLRSYALPFAALCLTVGCPSEAEDAAPEADAKPAPAAPADAKAPAAQPAAAAAVKRVWFTSPPDGATVRSPVHVAFGVEGMEISPAGQNMEDQTKGHHHVVIDGAPIAAGTAVPADEKNIHFGKGQTEADLELAPGKHSLTMQFADGAHLSYGPDVSQTINVVVVASEGAAKVSFKGPKDGAKVKSPVKLVFGLEGMKVRPAGEDPLDYTSGHHHVIVDGAATPAGTAVPADKTHIHYGKGQTEAELELAPGKHTLTMQLADGAHRSYGPTLSTTITVEVQP